MGLMLKFKSVVLKLGEVDGSKTVPARIQLMRVGNFKSDQYGAFKITRDTLAAMLSNFEANVRGYEDGALPIDYFHENDKEAAGWIKKLTLEADGTELWADVEWTPRAAEKIASREIRYTSAEFHFNYQDNETQKKFGPTLFGAGLTNRPFIKGMDAVIELAEEEGNQMNLEQALAKIAELEKQIAAMKSGGDDMDMMKKELADAKAKCEEYEASAKKAAEEKEAAEKAKALAEKKGKFDKMLAEGKVCEAQREPFMADDTIKFAESAKPVKLSTEGTGAGAGEEDAGKSAEDEVEEKAKKLSAEKKISFSQAVQSILMSDAALRERHAKATSVR